MKKNIFLTIFIAIVLIANFSFADYDTVVMSVVSEDSCTIEIGDYSYLEKSLYSTELNEKEVTLQLKVVNEEVATQPEGEVMLVIDNSNSMTTYVDDEETTTREDLVISSAEELITKMLEDNDNLKVGAVSFSTESVTSEGTINDASLVSELTSDADSLISAISSIEYTGPRTDLEAGLTLASQYFSSEDTNKYVIVLTDGVPNVAIDYDLTYYGQDVIDKTKAELQSLETSGYNVITMLTGIDEDTASAYPATNPDMTYGEIIEAIFGTEENPTVGTFYYIQDDEIEETISTKIYNELLPTEKVLTDIVITDYFPDYIVENFDIAVSTPSHGTISTEVDESTNSITWTIPELNPGETATVYVTLSLLETFSSEIVGETLDTNENLEITYTNYDGTTSTKESDDTPQLLLSEPASTLPYAGRTIIASLFAAVLIVGTISFIRMKVLNKDIK